MANEVTGVDSDTPWWHETPSLVSQTTHLTAYTGSTDSNPFDITPSVSSGYFDEDDGSNISDGSYSAHIGGYLMGYPQATASSIDSSSTLKNGQQSLYHNSTDYENVFSGDTVNTGNLDSTGTLVEADRLNVHSYDGPRPQKMEGDGVEGFVPGQSGFGPRVQGVPIGPVRHYEDRLPSKAFMKESDEESGLSKAHNYRHHRKDTAIVNAGPESQLSHSTMSIHQEILQFLAPQLMQNIRPLDLLPHLQQCNLLVDDDIDYIYDPSHSEKDKTKRILLSAHGWDGDALEQFAECLERDESHKVHVYLARKLREVIERKKLYPFKGLSSLRHHSHNHAHNHTHTQSSWQVPHEDVQTHPNTITKKGSPLYRVHSPLTSPGTASNTKKRKASNSEIKPVKRNERVNERKGGGKRVNERMDAGERVNGSGRSKLASAVPFFDMGMKMSQSLDPICAPEESYDSPDGHQSHQNRHQRRSSNKSAQMHFNFVPGNFSSLPRTNSQGSDIGTRGSKPYSSARYQNSATKQQPVPNTRKIISLTRNVSFHGTGEQHIIVSPLSRNPAVLSEETEDDSYLYRKGSSSSGTYANTGYQNMTSPELSTPLSAPVKRKHAIILEDTVTVKHAESAHTPSRSHSMSMQGEKRKGPYHPSLSREFDQQEKKKSSVHRGGSLQGSVDYPTRSNNYKDKKEDLTRKKHRRTKSYETSGSPHDQSVKELSGKRRGSECTPGKDVAAEILSVDSPQGTIEGGGPKRHASGSTVGSGVGENTSEGAGGTEDLSLRPDINQQKMTKKKMQWLQQKIKLKDFPEELRFDSLTRYHATREILYSGTLYEKGKPCFVILLTDMLLILKPKRKVGKLASRLGGPRQQFIDWFTDTECKMKTPLMLHLLSIEGKSLRTSNESFGLHYNKGSTLLKINLHAVSKEAKDIWLESLAEAIGNCTRANADYIIPVRHNVGNTSDEDRHTKLSLTIIEANNIAYSTNVITKNHYCTVLLGDLKCRTPSVKAKCWPTWNFKCDFSGFELEDVLQIEFYTERISSPDDFLGYVEVNLLSAAQKHESQLGVTEMQLKNQHLPLKDGKGTLTVNFQLKWTRETQK